MGLACPLKKPTHETPVYTYIHTSGANRPSRLHLGGIALGKPPRDLYSGGSGTFHRGPFGVHHSDSYAWRPPRQGNFLTTESRDDDLFLRSAGRSLRQPDNDCVRGCHGVNPPGCIPSERVMRFVSTFVQRQQNRFYSR